MSYEDSIWTDVGAEGLAHMREIKNRFREGRDTRETMRRRHRG
jgi:hypothetical protein